MCCFYQQMDFFKFQPKVKQLEQLNVEIEEGDEEIYRPSKTKRPQQEKVKWGKKKGSDEENSEKVELGFTPYMFNKNQQQKKQSAEPMTISKMFKNAPKPKRQIQEVSAQEADKDQEKDLRKDPNSRVA